MSAKDNINASKKYVLVPPDGGWGYIIGIAVSLNISISTMFTSSYGLLFKEFLRDIGLSSRNVALSTSINAVCVAIAGYLTNPLLSVMSIRMLTLLSTLIYNTGVICIVFANSVASFHLCYGFLQGAGLGFIYNLSCTILNEYFVKKRFIAICIVQTVIVIATTVGPIILKWSLYNFGFRDTVMLMAGVTMHNLIAVALIQPVKRNMKRVEITEENNEKLLNVKKTKSNEDACVVPIFKVTNAEGRITNIDDKMCNENRDTNYFNKIAHLLLEKSLCKTFLMSCVCAGPALAMFADITYADILPKALYTSGWEQSKVALIMSLYAFGDVTMRILLILLSTWLQRLGSQETYVLGITLALASRLGMLWSKTPIAMMVYNTLAGASHCTVSILIPLVVADAVTPEKFSAALGMFMMLTGIINLIFGPAFDAVKELTDSYGPVFYLIASCFAMILLFWAIELCYKKNKHKRMQRREYLQQKKLNK